eukprot:289785-Amphidinium_carterae.1
MRPAACAGCRNQGVEGGSSWLYHAVHPRNCVGHGTMGVALPAILVSSGVGALRTVTLCREGYVSCARCELCDAAGLKLASSFRIQMHS